MVLETHGLLSAEVNLSDDVLDGIFRENMFHIVTPSEKFHERRRQCLRS